MHFPFVCGISIALDGLVNNLVHSFKSYCADEVQQLEVAKWWVQGLGGRIEIAQGIEEKEDMEVVKEKQSVQYVI